MDKGLLHNRTLLMMGKVFYIIAFIHFQRTVTMRAFSGNIIPLSLVTILFLNSCSRDNLISIQHDRIKVDLYHDIPVFRNIIYSNDTLHANVGKGLTINGELKEWKKWNIRSFIQGDTVVYQMKLREPEIGADFIFWVDSSSVRMKIRNIEDRNNVLLEIGLQEQPWISVRDTSYRWWTVKNWTREPFVPKKVFSRGIGHYDAVTGNAMDTIMEKGMPFFACIWQPQKFLVALKTNMEVYPLRIWNDSAGCNLAPNKYYYKVKDQRMPDFEAQLAFIGDLNQNNQSDKGDYFVWCNRQMQGPDQLHKNAIWYKIKINDAGNKNHPSSTLAQSKEIIDYIKNITDNIPQIIYLVGWQYDGHDTGYPAFDKLNPRMGTPSELYALSRYCDSLGSVLSIHNNMCDAYKGNQYFSPEIMATDYDGTPMFWEVFADSAFHISHYKDVKSGMIFRRLEELFKIFPLHRSIHFDAMRVTNTNPKWEKEIIGVLEEYYLGLKPIAEWLRQKGVLITTETQNGNPVDLSPIAVGMWTYFRLLPDYRQIYHGKIVGGGIPEFDAPLKYSAGMGNSITQDFTYRKYAGHLDYETQKVHMKEVIHLSSMLYQFLLTKEMLEVDRNDYGYRIRFSDDVLSVYDKKTDHLKVTWKDMVIAEDDERFIPVHGGIYAYSKGGSERQWRLPEAYRNTKLKVVELTDKGRKEFRNFKIVNDDVILTLSANQSVKIIVE